jgi:hypothetical protein
MNSKLFNISTLNLNQIELSETETKSVPGQKISYQRVRLGIRQDDELHDLLIRSVPSLLSWGVQESRDIGTNELNGYQLPIVLWTNKGTQEERNFTNGFHNFCEYLKGMLIERKDSFGKYDLERSDLKRFNPLYWKTEKGKVVEEKGPTFYAKCLFDRNRQKINTLFVNELTKEVVDPKTLIGKHLFLSFVLRVEGVFIGNRLSLQMRVTEVLYREKEDRVKSLLCPDAMMKTEMLDCLSDECCESDENETSKPVPVLPCLSHVKRTHNSDGTVSPRPSVVKF